MIGPRLGLLAAGLLVAACGGSPATVESHPTDADELRAAGVALRVPSGCELRHRTPRGGTIACPGAVVDLLDGAAADVDGLVGQLEAQGVEVTERASIGCRVGTVEGEGEAMTIETLGRRAPLLVCVVPHAAAHTVVRCTGYDPRVRPRTDPPVPAPCDQLLPWQPVLTGAER